MPNIYGTAAVPTLPTLSAVIDINGAANTVVEDAAIGTSAGVTAFAEHTGYVVTYSLSDSASGKFAIHATSGAVTKAVSLISPGSQTITILATSSEGSTASLTTTIVVTDNGSLYLDDEAVVLDDELVELT